MEDHFYPVLWLDTWPPQGHTLLYGDLQPHELNRANITTRLNTFAKAAFRRPLRDQELAPIEHLVATKLDGACPKNWDFPTSAILSRILTAISTSRNL